MATRKTSNNSNAWSLLLIPVLVIAGAGMASARTREEDYTDVDLQTDGSVDIDVFANSKGCDTANGRWKRNNNPGNIRINPANKWQGRKLPNTDGSYEQFVDMVWGTRAMIRVLLTYIGRGQNTVNSIVRTYAPPVENQTQLYVDYVANKTGLGRNTPIKPEKEPLRKIVKAMARIETGCDAVTDAMFDQAWSLR